MTSLQARNTNGDVTYLYVRFLRVDLYPMPLEKICTTWNTLIIYQLDLLIFLSLYLQILKCIVGECLNTHPQI